MARRRLETGKFVETHGRSRMPIYRTWQGMMARCYKPGTNGYDRYGGVGITVCKRWHKFENFLKDMGDRPANTTLDRKDNRRGYSRANCRWSTRAEQLRNRSCTKLITFEGKSLTVREWSDLLGIDLRRLRGRFEQGWSPERALTTLDRVVAPKQITYRGKTQSLAAWAKELGLKYGTLHARMRVSGMTFEEAINR